MNMAAEMSRPIMPIQLVLPQERISHQTASATTAAVKIHPSTLTLTSLPRKCACSLPLNWARKLSNHTKRKRRPVAVNFTRLSAKTME